MMISEYLLLGIGNDLVYCSLLDGTFVSRVKGIGDEPYKAMNFANNPVNELLVLSQGKQIYVYAQEFRKNVTESEMQWRIIYKFPIPKPTTCLTITKYNQIITSDGGSLQIYSARDEENRTVYDIVSSFQKPRPIYHPNYLLELMRLHETGVIKEILESLSNDIDHDSVKESLLLDLETLCSQASTPSAAPAAPAAPQTAANDMDWFFDSMPSYNAPSTSPTLSPTKNFNARTLVNKLNQMETNIPGLDLLDLRQLVNLVQTFQEVNEQSRALDDFASIFFIHVKIFRHFQDLQMPRLHKPRCLNTMEICWALHTEQ